MAATYLRKREIDRLKAMATAAGFTIEHQKFRDCDDIQAVAPEGRAFRSNGCTTYVIDNRDFAAASADLAALIGYGLEAEQ